MDRWLLGVGACLLLASSLVAQQQQQQQDEEGSGNGTEKSTTSIRIVWTSFFQFPIIYLNTSVHSSAIPYEKVSSIKEFFKLLVMKQHLGIRH